jgi:SnoaL-like protein
VGGRRLPVTHRIVTRAERQGEARCGAVISPKWTHGGKAIIDGLRQAPIEDLRTEVRDIDESTWGDVGLVTCWIEQDYTFQGKGQHVSAPTTLLFRKMGSDWRMVLFHSVPLPDAS